MLKSNRGGIEMGEDVVKNPKEEGYGNRVDGNNRKKLKETIEDLVRRAKDGDEEAIQAVIEQYKPFVMKCCHKFSIPSYDFDDLVQYSYLSILKAIRLYNFGKVHFTSYVMTAIRNNLGDLLRKNVKQYREVNHQESFEMDYPDEGFDLERELVEKESIGELNAAIDRMDSEDREILEEFYLKKMPLRVIAESRGYSCTGIGKRKKRILKKLRDEIDKDKW